MATRVRPREAGAKTTREVRRKSRPDTLQFGLLLTTIGCSENRDSGARSFDPLPFLAVAGPLGRSMGDLQHAPTTCACSPAGAMPDSLLTNSSCTMAPNHSNK